MHAQLQSGRGQNVIASWLPYVCHCVGCHMSVQCVGLQILGREYLKKNWGVLWWYLAEDKMEVYGWLVIGCASSPKSCELTFPFLLVPLTFPPSFLPTSQLKSFFRRQYPDSGAIQIIVFVVQCGLCSSQLVGGRSSLGNSRKCPVANCTVLMTPCPGKMSLWQWQGPRFELKIQGSQEKLDTSGSPASSLCVL